MGGGKRVAVIGAGLSGLAATKYCLEEGLEPVCFEQHDQIGGTWYFTEHIRPNQGAAAYRELIANDTRELMCFSDYPAPKGFPMCAPRNIYLDYLKSYANHFNVTKHIVFNTTVIKVEPTSDHHQTGRWKVHTRKTEMKNAPVIITEFDKIMVTAGPYQKSNTPDIPGLKDFAGECMHAISYRTKDIFKNKKVLIVGGQVFAVEAAAYAGMEAEQVYLGLRREGGLYIFPRRQLDNNQAFSTTFTRNLAYTDFEKVYPAIQANGKKYFDVTKYDMAPRDPVLLGGRIAVVDYLPDFIKEGKVAVKRGIKRFNKKSVVFENGEEKEIDFVLFATGFNIDLDYIDIPGVPKGTTKCKDMDLYLWTMPVHDKHHSMAVINIAPLYMPYAISAEMQSRLGARVLAGKHQLPSEEKMQQWVEDKRKYFKEKAKGKEQMIPIRFPDEIATELGAFPSFWKIFLRSPSLAHKVYYGPNLPIVYRFFGPSALKSAFKDYHTWWDRVYEDCIPPTLPWGIHHYLMLLTVFLVVIVAVLLYHV